MAAICWASAVLQRPAPRLFQRLTRRLLAHEGQSPAPLRLLATVAWAHAILQLPPAGLFEALLPRLGPSLSLAIPRWPGSGQA